MAAKKKTKKKQTKSKRAAGKKVTPTKKLDKKRDVPKKKSARKKPAPKKAAVKNEARPQQNNRREDGERTQETGSGKKPERGYRGIPTGGPGSEFGPAIGRFAGIVQRRRCRFGECRRVALRRKRVRERRGEGRGRRREPASYDPEEFVDGSQPWPLAAGYASGSGQRRASGLLPGRVHLPVQPAQIAQSRTAVFPTCAAGRCGGANNLPIDHRVREGGLVPKPQPIGGT